MAITTAEKSASFPGWSGSRDDLRKLIELVVEQSAPIADRAVEDADSPPPVTERRIRESFEPEIELLQVRPKLTHTGGMELFDEDSDVEFGKVRHATVRIGSHHSEERIYLFFKFGSVRLVIKGRPRWITSSSAVISGEIRRCVPWWVYLRSPGFILICCLAPAVISIATGRFFSAEAWTIEGGGGEIVLAAVASVLVAVIYLAFCWLPRLLIPVIDIVEPPDRSKAIRAICYIATFTLGVAGNVVAAAIYSG